uniref:Large ribosomal subunit protein eL31 n=1 Tax=Loxodonta africana TaxID=9785 RepID=G3UHN6_LOXAF
AFPTWSRNSGKKGCSAISEVVAREDTLNIHESIHGMGFKKGAPWTLRETQIFAMKETGTPDMHTDTRLSKAAWAKGIRHVLHCIHGQLSREHSDAEKSPNKLYRSVTCVPVTTSQNPQTVSEN